MLKVLLFIMSLCVALTFIACGEEVQTAKPEEKPEAVEQAAEQAPAEPAKVEEQPASAEPAKTEETPATPSAEITLPPQEEMPSEQPAPETK